MLKASAAVVKNGSAYTLVKNALALLDAKERIRPDYKVLVKPNLVRVPSTSPYACVEGAYEKSWAPEGDVVHREILEGLLHVLRDFGVEDITIGEGSGGCQTPVAFKALELYELAEEYGASLVDLNYADSVRLKVPNGLVLDHVWLPKIVLESDFRISLTTMKLHGTTAVSFCLKNWGLGIPPARYYGFPKCRGGLEEGLPIHSKLDREKFHGQGVGTSQVIVDICSAQGYDLGVIDGLTTLHHAGLSPGNEELKIERTNMVIASFDMVAVDVMAARVAGLDHQKILHIKLATERRLGKGDLEQIEVLGKSIAEAQLTCNPLYEQREIALHVQNTR